MEKFLTNHINTVYKNFIAKKWCDINNFELNTDSYTNETIQEFYILKYFPAYFSEYYLMYQDLIDKLGEEENLNVLSIGCGSGIDYYALKFALKEKNIADNRLTYYGIDCIDWLYKPKSRDFNFIHTNIDDFDNLFLQKTNIIIFPKSLIEFQAASLTSFADKLINNNSNKTIFFLNSYITNDAHNAEHIGGIKEFQPICQQMEQNGFKTKTKQECIRYYRAEEQRGLGKDFHFFKYPNDIKETLTSLTEKCPKEDILPECTTCRIGAWPILNNKYVAYNIIRFQK